MKHVKSEKPIFMVITESGHEYKIWPDGRTEGFGGGIIVFNRIPQLKGRLLNGESPY